MDNILMLPKRYELTEVDRRTWATCALGDSTSSGTHQAKERSYKSWKAMSKKIQN